MLVTVLVVVEIVEDVIELVVEVVEDVVELVVEVFVVELVVELVVKVVLLTDIMVELVVVVKQFGDDDMTLNTTQYWEDWSLSLNNSKSFDSLKTTKIRSEKHLLGIGNST